MVASNFDAFQSKNPVYELKQSSSSDQSSDENLERAYDRNDINRPSMSSFRDKEINEQVARGHMHYMNQSLTKRSPESPKSFLGSFKNKFGEMKILEPLKIIDTFSSIESCGMNENSGPINPKGYAFNTVLPKQGLSKYRSSSQPEILIEKQY
jgi:hypothetical protein